MEDRKRSHIDFAFKSRISADEANPDFFYEPLLAAHPHKEPDTFSFAGKVMKLPVWISSMTGGTKMAGKINRNLAMLSRDFGLGMGLGSCRSLLDSHRHLQDFDIRKITGEEVPLFANLGIAQLETLLENKEIHRIEELLELLKADGIIIHVNPLQEAFQPEGEIFKHPPIKSIEAFLSQSSVRVIVKEVGQGMGPQSLKRLLSLPLEAVEFGALGGTNFTKQELLRHKNSDTQVFDTFGRIGHTAREMTLFVNEILADTPEVKCKKLIISGGIRDVLEGYYLTKISKIPAVFGMGAAFLQYAMGDYEDLKNFMTQIKQSLLLASQYLIPK